jgi:GSH-dependent disulfide-bond oxidoreductase
MIDLYYWPASDGHKISIAMEEMGLAYNLIPIDIGPGEQFQERFPAIRSNQGIPTIADPATTLWGCPRDPVSEAIALR